MKMKTNNNHVESVKGTRGEDKLAYSVVIVYSYIYVYIAIDSTIMPLGLYLVRYESSC